MIRLLQYVPMIPSTCTSMTSKNFHLIVSPRFDASLKTVSFRMFILKLLTYLMSLYEIVSFFLTYLSDKKNENKEVAVNDFLPSSTAVDAIQYSMSVYFELPSFLYFSTSNSNHILLIFVTNCKDIIAKSRVSYNYLNTFNI